MKHLIWLPLEPLEIRYTSQWARWFPKAFNEEGIEFLTVEGQALTKSIEVGSVLDAYGTNYWKSTQMANLIEKIHSGEVTGDDVLLFADLWSPGIEALQYIACLGGQRPKIAGILHAGTWDSNDFTVRQGMRPWGHQLEQAWFQMYDLVFVATQYHKDLILQSHCVDPDKIVVTGLPFYPDEFTESRQKIKRNQQRIVFPHRLDKEKHPDEFDALINDLWEWPDIRPLKTAVGFYSKDGYYNDLAESSIAVSMATQETFGYAMLEATALGCIPLVPDRLSYQEIFPKWARYSDHYDLKHKVELVLANPSPYRRKTYALARQHRQEYTQSISKMCCTVLQRFG